MDGWDGLGPSLGLQGAIGDAAPWLFATNVLSGLLDAW